MPRGAEQTSSTSFAVLSSSLDVVIDCLKQVETIAGEMKHCRYGFVKVDEIVGSLS
jgi:hypothetical protein